MMEVRDFVATLTRARKSQKEIKPLLDTAYSDKALSISQLDRIIKAVKEGVEKHLGPPTLQCKENKAYR
jgi:hypothetical protein